jgi:septal ring factor EnvC (AmiA/AmiB activator)
MPPHTQAANAKQMKELLAVQNAVAQERAQLDAQQEEIKARRAEVAAQVCFKLWFCEVAAQA